MKYVTLAILAILSTIRFAAAEEVLEEIQFSDPNWGGYPAYFVEAPRSIVASMALAVHSFCAEATALVHSAEELAEGESAEARRKTEQNLEQLEAVYPVCEEDVLGYYVGMTGLYNLTKWGYVCRRKVGVEGQRAFAEFMLKDWAECTRVEWHEDLAKHELIWRNDA